MAMIGANLAGLGGLTTKFTATGELFAGKSSDIVKRIDTAVNEFQTEMNSLKREADSLGSEIRTTMAGLKGRAEATVWTGNNKTRHDGVVAAFDSEIEAVKTAIASFSAEAKTIVDGALKGSMNELGSSTSAYGTQARSVAGNFGTSVTSQQQALDAVMNG